MADIDERIRVLEEHVESLADDLRVLRTLVEHDHASALNKMRYITEKVLHHLCTDNDVKWGKADPTLERMIGPLVAKKIIPKNVAIHVRTIQTNASPGSHFQEEALTSTHVLIAQVALVDFLEWHAREPLKLGDSIPSAASVPAAKRKKAEPSGEGRPPWLVPAAVGAVVVAGVAAFVLLNDDGDETEETTSVAGTEPPDEEATDAGPPVPALPFDGFRIGDDVSLEEAAQLWWRLRRADRHSGITFLGTDDSYSVMVAGGTPEAEASEVAEAVGLEASPHRGVGGDRLVPRQARLTTSLNLREGPDTDQGTIRVLPPHTLVVVIEGTVEGSTSVLGDEGFLYVVATEADRGWVAARFVDPDHRCLPSAEPFLEEAPSGRVEALRRDLVHTRSRVLTSEGSAGAFVLFARDLELGRSHVGVFLERGRCNLERRFFSTVDGIVEGALLIETEREEGESLLLTHSHPSAEVGSGGHESWHAYRLGSTDPVWTLVAPTAGNLPRWRRAAIIPHVRRAGSTRGYWPLRLRHPAGEGSDYYRWDGDTLEIDPAVSREPPAESP